MILLMGGDSINKISQSSIFISVNVCASILLLLIIILGGVNSLVLGLENPAAILLDKSSLSGSSTQAILLACLLYVIC